MESPRNHSLRDRGFLPGVGLHGRTTQGEIEDERFNDVNRDNRVGVRPLVRTL
jgi:hypothetical protein